MISKEAFYDRKYSQKKIELKYCYECEKETEHEIAEGHNGFDRWSSSDCLECLEKLEES